MKAMLSTQDAADRAKCPRITIQKAIARGRLKAKKQGRDWFIETVDFNRWIKSRTVKKGKT